MTLFNLKSLANQLQHGELTGRELVHQIIYSFFILMFILYFPFLPCLTLSKWFLLEIVVILFLTYRGLCKAADMAPQNQGLASDLMCLSGIVAVRTVIPVMLFLAALIFLTDSLVAQISDDKYWLLYEVLDASVAIFGILEVYLFFYVMNRTLSSMRRSSSGSPGSAATTASAN